MNRGHAGLGPVTWGLLAALWACDSRSHDIPVTDRDGGADGGADGSADGSAGEDARSRYQGGAEVLNAGPCEDTEYRQEALREPLVIEPANGHIQTDLVVRLRERCVPVWETDHWEMQTLSLRTYGFPRTSDTVITPEDADDPDTDKLVWSAPGPTFLLHPASAPGAGDGTRFEATLYNRMPPQDDPTACEREYKCQVDADSGVETCVDAGIPAQEIDGQVIEPPNCFHGANSTNFHFHGFHVSSQAGQDNVLLELRPPSSGSHSGDAGHAADVAYGQTHIALDPLRYTQAPGTHWYHAHKHGSTAIQVLNGLVGTFRVWGEFDDALVSFFEGQRDEMDGGGPTAALVDRLLVVQQLQEKPPGVGGADQTGALLVNGMANPIVTMAPGEIQRWRFVSATMQASAHLRLGFPERSEGENPEVRQIAMDGVQFSRANYVCQPFVNEPDCDPEADQTPFDEATSFELAPGNRVDVLVRAPTEPGTHCFVLNPASDAATEAMGRGRRRGDRMLRAEAASCGLDTQGLPPLFTLEVKGEPVAMRFPTEEEFPKHPAFLNDIPEVTDTALQKTVHYEMVNRGNQAGSQFWINQQKFDPSCANETLVVDEPQRWTLRNNTTVAHPFHIHQNPFQLVSVSRFSTLDGGVLDDGGVGDGGLVWEELSYAHPVWRDTLALPTAVSALEPNSETDPDAVEGRWGKAVIRYVAREFTGPFVQHCHILGHEDRGMMHATQSVCPVGFCDDGLCYATTSPVEDPARCTDDGFCPGDCDMGTALPAAVSCPEPPDQTSDWPASYDYDGGA